MGTLVSLVGLLTLYTHRLWLVLEGKHHRLREVGYFGVWHDDTQDLLTQDLAGILVLNRRDGGGE